MEEGSIHQGAHSEATINPNGLEDALRNALKNHLPRLESTSGARAQFYNKFKREADEYDNDFLEKYRGDLETTLIFSGLFSAVASAFIVAVQSQLQPDYTQLSYHLLWMMANSTGLSPPPKPSGDSPWTGPDPALVNVQAILYSSLAASLLAAFVAVLGKQWLSRYSQVDMRGSLVDRSRDRQRKMNGMVAWGFMIVMESLPLMLQGALLLLGCALSKYLFTIDNRIAWVVLVFTASGLLFYMAIVIAASISYDCPFQTPLSLLVRFLVRFDGDHRKYLKRSRKWFLRTFSRKKRRRRQQGGLGPGGPDEREHIQLNIVHPPHLPPVPFEKETDRDGFVLDSNCIVWMFEMTMDPDVILDITKFIPEIIWHDGIGTTPLEKLYDTVLECFDCSSGSPVLLPKFRKKAYLSAKALLHLAIQRKCMGDRSEVEVFESLSRRHPIIEPWKWQGDSDLHYTLGMMDRVFKGGDFEPMRWAEFSFTSSHHAWMGYILPYRAWYALRNDGALPHDISEFLRHASRQDPLPPTPIMSGCLLIICLVLGVRPDSDDNDQHVIGVDESQKLHSRISRIFPKLVEIFQNTESSAIQIDYALEAMGLITAIPEREVAMKSFELFHVVTGALVSSVYTQEKKWKASRLALHGAYKSDQFLPHVEDPRPILDFLEYHFDLATRHGKNQDGPIRNALRALTSASGPAMNEAFNHFDPTKRSFVDGILHVFQRSEPPRLLKPALFFLPLIADRWFNAPSLIMKPNEMERLCEGWAAAVDKVWSTDDIREPALAVLLDMINSPRWRSYVAKDKWELLEHLASVSDDSQPLLRCLGNPGLVDAILEVKNKDLVILWWTLLWSKYDNLSPVVQNRFHSAVKGAQREDVDRYLSVTKAESEEARQELLGYDPWSTDPKAIALRAKVAKLETIRRALNYMQSVT